MPDLNLAAEFPPVSTAEWEAAIRKDLKGADYDKKLVWRTEEGLAVRPYYRSEIKSTGTWFRRDPSWQISQDYAPGPEAVRADRLHEDGAHAVQELAYAIAEAVERLSAGPLAEMEFVFAAGPHYFIEIAKFRAARLLWSKVIEAFGIDCPMRLHVRTPARNKSRLDPYNNLLRVTTEAMSAAAGGCDSLSVEPFGFDDHLAVNVQRILQYEAHVDAVADPARGSYYIEALTAMLAEAAWKLFQQVESEGGYTKSKPQIDQSIAETRIAREKAVSTRRRILVGVNHYANLTEKASEFEGLVGQAGHTPGPPAHRLAEPFERIRAHTAHMKTRPRIALLKRGDPKMRSARATFCLNFFGCAGFEVIECESLEGLNPGLVVLCSSDPEYLALAQEIVPQAQAPVIVAGNPKEQIEALKAAGIQGFVHIQSDMIETLTYWQERLSQ